MKQVLLALFALTIGAFGQTSTVTVGSGGVLKSPSANSFRMANGLDNASNLTLGKLNNERLSAQVILSTGSYSNPSWLTDVAYTKLTGVPAALSYIATKGFAPVKYFATGSALLAGTQDFQGQILASNDGSFSFGNASGNAVIQNQNFYAKYIYPIGSANLGQPGGRWSIIYGSALNLDGTASVDRLLANSVSGMHQKKVSGSTYTDNVEVITNASESAHVSLGTVAFDATANTVTRVAHGLADGAVVKFTTTGTLPTATGGNIVAGTNYLVTNCTTDTFQLERGAQDEGVIDLTSTGTGVNSAERFNYGFTCLTWGAPHGSPNGNMVIGTNPSSPRSLTDFRDFSLATNATDTTKNPPGFCFSAHKGGIAEQHRLLRWDGQVHDWTCYGWTENAGIKNIGSVGWNIAADGRMGVGTSTLVSGTQLTVSGKGNFSGQLSTNADMGVGTTSPTSVLGAGGRTLHIASSTGLPSLMVEEIGQRKWAFCIGGSDRPLLLRNETAGTNPVSIHGNAFNSSLVIESNGTGTLQFGIKNGANGTLVTRMRHGTATLAAGTVTVNDAQVTANTRIFAFANDNAVVGTLREDKSSRVAGTSFKINSSAADAGLIVYQLIEP